MPGMESEVQEQDIFVYIKDHKKEIIISFIAAAALIFVVTALAGLDDIIKVLETTNPWLLALNFALEALILILWTLRWKMILDLVDDAPRFRSLLLMLTASLFGNNITPGAAGGEPLRAYILREIKGTPFEIGFASSTADRVFEFLPFVLISILAAFLILSWNIALWIRLGITIIIFLIVIFFSVVVYAGANQHIAQRLALSVAKSVFPLALRLTRRDMHFSEIRDQIIFYVHRFTTGFGMALKDRQVLVVGIVLSFGMWALDMVRLYVCFLAVGVQVPIIPLVVIYTVGILIQLLPLIPGSLGIREAILVGLFAVAGITADYVMAASIIDRLASYIAPTLIGAFAAFYYGKIMVSKNKPEPS
jgi:glycosyltransferase 2 family protein